MVNVVSHESCNSCLSQNEKDDKDLLEDVHTYAKLRNDPRADLPSSFTICSSSMTTYGIGFVFFNLLGDDGNKLLGPRLQVYGMKTSFYHAKWLDVKLPAVFSYQWVKSCISINSETGHLQWVADGSLVDNATVSQLKDVKNKPTDLSGKIVLGAFQHTASKKWTLSYSFHNQITNLNIYSTALTIKEMQQNTIQNCGLVGDYLAWQDIQWDIKGETKIYQIDAKEACTGHPSFNLFPAYYNSMESCRHFCGKLGSRSPSIVLFQQWANIRENLAKLIDNNKVMFIWLALNDENTNGEWLDYYDGKLVNFSLPWGKGEPNGGTKENCAVFHTPSGKLLDWTCESPDPNFELACMCERTPAPYLKLRGLCPDSSIQDTLFQTMNNFTDLQRLTLVGHKNLIHFDRRQKIWKLTDAEYNVTGFTKAPHNSFTLGRHNWTIRGDKGCKEDGADYKTELKMTGCQDESFTCNDGQCVSMEQRCNQLPDCEDLSDEDNCKVVVLGKSYNRNVPPIKNKHEKVNVNISLDILKLVDIDEHDYSIEIQFSITLKWNETRATYQNLKEEKTMNGLTKGDISQLWLPEVIYENTDQKDTTRLGDTWEWATQVFVERQGNWSSSGLDIVDEIEIFKGSENNLLMSQTYTRKFQCSYDFHKYPFDAQVGEIIFKRNLGPCVSVCF